MGAQGVWLRRALIGILVGAMTMGLSPASGADPSWPKQVGWKGCPAPTWPTQKAAGLAGGARILVIGDSLTRESRTPLVTKLRQDGWTPTIRCWGGKRMDWGIAQIRRAKKLGQLPDTVVMALGINDMRLIARPITAQRVRTALDALGTDRTIYWVNMHFAGPGSPGLAKERWFNRLLRAEAAKRPNLRIVDWAQWARDRGIRPRDGLHYGAVGRVQRAEAIRQAVRAGLPPAPEQGPTPDPGLTPQAPPESPEISATRGVVLR